MSTKGLMPREYDFNACVVEVNISYEAQWVPTSIIDNVDAHWEASIESAAIHSIYWYVGDTYCEMRRDQLHLRVRDLLDEVISRIMMAESEDILADLYSYLDDMSEYHSREM